MPTLALQSAASVDGVSLYSVNKSHTDNEVITFNQVGGVPTATTSQLFEVEFTLTGAGKLKMCAITSDQPVDIYTNAVDGTGGQHIALAAGDEINWLDGQSIAACPFTLAVTKMYINNASGFVANLKMAFSIHSS